MPSHAQQMALCHGKNMHNKQAQNATNKSVPVIQKKMAPKTAGLFGFMNLSAAAGTAETENFNPDVPQRKHSSSTTSAISHFLQRFVESLMLRGRMKNLR